MNKSLMKGFSLVGSNNSKRSIVASKMIVKVGLGTVNSKLVPTKEIPSALFSD